MKKQKRIPVYKNDSTQDPKDIVGWIELDANYERHLAVALEDGVKFQLSGTINLNDSEILSCYFFPVPVEIDLPIHSNFTYGTTID